MGNVRDRRHLKQIEEWLRRAGFTHVATNLALRDGGDTLTDLDFVAIPEGLQDLLVLQLKSFVTPTNLLTIDKAESDVQKAISQCTVGAQNLAAVRRAVEARFGINLPESWRLYQVIVAEAHTGLSDPHPEYPVVTLHWVEQELEKCPGAARFWQDARDLPDAQPFFASLLPSFAVYESWNTPLCLDEERFAVFQYSADGM